VTGKAYAVGIIFFCTPTFVMKLETCSSVCYFLIDASLLYFMVFVGKIGGSILAYCVDLCVEM
jgi:hypothetical protein